MTDVLKPTDAAAIAPPTQQADAELVTLAFLRDTAGEPVQVLVAPVSELVLIDAVAALPGHGMPQEGIEQASLVEMWAQFEPAAARIIETACTPRFSFSEPTPEGCVPGSYLRAADRMALVLTCLRVSGWFGGAAGEMASSFLRRRSDGAAGHEAAPGGDSVGVMDAVHEDEPAAVGAIQPAEVDQ